MRCVISAIFVFVSFLMLVPISGHAAVIDPNAAKLKLRQMHGVAPPIARADASLASCTAHNSQVALINNTYKACTNPDTPPPGSPIFNFNAMSNIQLGSYCGSLPFDQCINKVNAEQKTYCDNIVQPLKVQDEKFKAECAQANRECTAAKARKQQVEKQHNDLEAKKKQLETELQSVLNQLASNHAALQSANAEVGRQCKIQLPVTPPLLPPQIKIPPGFHLPPVGPPPNLPPVGPQPPRPPAGPQPQIPPPNPGFGR